MRDRHNLVIMELHNGLTSSWIGDSIQKFKSNKIEQSLSRQVQNDHFRFGGFFVTIPQSQIVLFTILLFIRGHQPFWRKVDLIFNTQEM